MAGGGSAWSGGFGDQVKRLRHERKPFVPPEMKHVSLERSEHYLDQVRHLNPRKYMGKGVHKKYGGPVDIHASEFCFGVTLDPDRDRGRQMLEPGKGEEFSPGTNMAQAVLDRRNPKERMPRNKGGMFAGEDGEWLKKMWEDGKFLVRELDGQIGHAAPGAALGYAGKWPDPRSAADPERFRRIRDKWRVHGGEDGHVPWEGRLV